MLLILLLFTTFYSHAASYNEPAYTRPMYRKTLFCFEGTQCRLSIHPEDIDTSFLWQMEGHFPLKTTKHRDEKGTKTLILSMHDQTLESEAKRRKQNRLTKAFEHPVLDFIFQKSAHAESQRECRIAHNTLQTIITHPTLLTAIVTASDAGAKHPNLPRSASDIISDLCQIAKDHACDITDANDADFQYKNPLNGDREVAIEHLEAEARTNPCKAFKLKGTVPMYISFENPSATYPKANIIYATVPYNGGNLYIFTPVENTLNDTPGLQKDVQFCADALQHPTFQFLLDSTQHFDQNCESMKAMRGAFQYNTVCIALDLYRAHKGTRSAPFERLARNLENTILALSRGRKFYDEIHNLEKANSAVYASTARYTKPQADNTTRAFPLIAKCVFTLDLPPWHIYHTLYTGREEKPDPPKSKGYCDTGWRLQTTQLKSVYDDITTAQDKDRAKTVAAQTMLNTLNPGVLGNIIDALQGNQTQDTEEGWQAKAIARKLTKNGRADIQTLIARLKSFKDNDRCWIKEKDFSQSDRDTRDRAQVLGSYELRHRLFFAARQEQKPHPQESRSRTLSTRAPHPLCPQPLPPVSKELTPPWLTYSPNEEHTFSSASAHTAPLPQIEHLIREAEKLQPTQWKTAGPTTREVCKIIDGQRFITKAQALLCTKYTESVQEALQALQTHDHTSKDVKNSLDRVVFFASIICEMQNADSLLADVIDLRIASQLPGVKTIGNIESLLECALIDGPYSEGYISALNLREPSS